MISARQNTAFSTNKTLNLNGRLLDLRSPIVMGILNLTPDSFYDGGRHTSEASILHHVELMLSQGAAIIDVGGYSSRPGATDIPPDEEYKRVIPAITAICKRFTDVIISIDTFRASVAKAALDSGALMVNDISGGDMDKAMIATVASFRVPYICMHMRGTPQTMTSETDYENLVADLITYFHTKLEALRSKGITDCIIDPGFGFAKNVDQNFELLNNLDHLIRLECPVLVGVSRKSMIWRTLNTDASQALNGTTALHMAALLKGASILRAHDVKEACETVKLFSSLSRSAH